MGNIIAYTEPRIVGNGQNKEPRVLLGQPAQNAAWRRGDFLQVITTGTISAPPVNGTGALATSAGPSVAAGTLVLATSASAGAPRQTYYGQASYTLTSQESALSAPFIINCPAGYLPSVNVTSAGAPAGATNFAVYLGTQPGSLSLQQATRTTTALGTPYVAANPLTNSIGWNRSVTNPSTAVVGMAQNASNENFFSGGGGSFAVGAGSLLGADTTIPPLAPYGAQGAYAIYAGNGQLFEMNLIQTTAFYPSLLGTTAGLALDTASGFFIVDPGGSNKILTIVDWRKGVSIGPTATGDPGDGGVRVVVSFNSGLAF